MLFIYLCNGKNLYDMKTNALSVANYFVDIALKQGEDLRPLKLMKLVYIAYGYALALLGRSILDERFDKVEAWRLGPVIPCVYHSFKIYGKDPIKKKTVVFEFANGEPTIETPTLEDEEVKKVCDFVWGTYGKKYNDGELVTLLHGKGTPWGRVFEQGKNVPIPELYTQLYYTELVRAYESRA